MQHDISRHISRCIALMLEPVVEFCLSRGVHFQDFLELSRRSFVSAAEKQLQREGRDSTVSKISVMTGLQRPEIGRLRHRDDLPKSKDLIVRVIGQWVGDKRFLNSKGLPKPLKTTGAKSEFAKLVTAVSKDLNPHTVRFEMERIGVLECGEGVAKLVRPAFIVNGDPIQIMNFIAEDSRDLLASIQENAMSVHFIPNLHARTSYDNIADEDIPVIREWFIVLGKRIHEECRRFLSKFDRDISHGRTAGAGKNRVILATFSRVEALNENSLDQEKARK